MRPQALTETALFSALAIVLSYLIIFRAPQGGSVSLVMAPILIISLKQGVWPGIFCGVVTGAITFMFGGFFVAPLQVICDYLLAFGSIGLAGCFSHKFLAAMKRGDKRMVLVTTLLAGLVAGVLRLLFHTLAGIALRPQRATRLAVFTGLQQFVCDSRYNFGNHLCICFNRAFEAGLSSVSWH